MIVDLDVRKWGDRPQYRMGTELLGRDDHGTWLGLPTGNAYVGPSGPGVLENGSITVVPEKQVVGGVLLAGPPAHRRSS